MQPIKEEIRSFIKENLMFARSIDSFGDDTSFLDSGLVDSTGLLELIAFIEDKFGFKIENEELTPDNLDSIDKIVRYIEGKCRASSSSGS